MRDHDIEVFQGPKRQALDDFSKRKPRTIVERDGDAIRFTKTFATDMKTNTSTFLKLLVFGDTMEVV